MKRKTILLAFTHTFFLQSIVAQEFKSVFDPKVPVVWLGLDFTGTIFIGDREKLGSENDIKYLIGSWTSLLLDEKEKFNIHAMLNKQKVEYRLDITRSHNENLSLKNFYSDKISDHFHLKKDDIQAIVSRYDFDNLEGLGLLFNIETFNKSNVEASIWITFINLQDKSVVFTERITAPPSGFGLRNYWAGALYAAIKSITKKDFEAWRKKYSR